MPVPTPRTSTPSQPTRYSDYAPDTDPITPGNVQSSFGYYPSEKGFRTFPGQRVLGSGLPSTCLGAYSGILLTLPTATVPAPPSTPILVGATAQGLYVADANSNMKVSQLGFLNGTGTNPTNRWRFAAYGQDLLAVNGVDADQFYRLSAAKWAPLPAGADGSTAPVAAIVEATDYAIILVPPNSYSFVSSLSDSPPSWLGSVPNQVYIQPIQQTEGAITAIRRLRNTAIFYKANSMFVGYFNGGTTGWDVQEVSLQIGAPCQEAVINTGDYHYFYDGVFKFWQFDGWNLTELPNHLIEWLQRDINPAYAQNMAGQFDSSRDLLIWCYSSKYANPEGSFDSRLIHYRRQQRWAFERLAVDLPIPSLYQAPSTGLQYAGFFSTEHAPIVYDNAVTPGQAYITSNLFGDYFYVFESQRVRPGFGPNGYPTYSTLTALNQNKGGGYQWIGPTETLTDDGWYDLKNTARLQSYQLTTRGFAEVIELQPVLIPCGDVG
jgi:hypothetical protein